MAEGSDKIPFDEYERTHGTIGADHKPLNEAEAFGTKQNPLRETEVPYTGLREPTGGG